jgi:cobalt-precorrin-5B (C1)-methyltransferase
VANPRDHAGAAPQPSRPGHTSGTSHPPLREPDLPRTAKVRDGPLRNGATTGKCETTTTPPPALVLAGGAPPAAVTITLPKGQHVTFAVARCEGTRDRAEAVVVKDAGDDPDCTDGAHLTVRLDRRRGAGVVFHAGDGVGTVTKPGLGLAVGGPAINDTPRRMITDAVTEVLGDDTGVDCTVSVPGGERMAIKTTNRRLGIVGGISILGTTGIVRPFSTASWRASVEQAIDVLAAQGAATVVLATGGRTEKAAMRLLPDLDEGAFVEVGDFTGAALHRMVAGGLHECVFVGMVGKLAKLGAGILMTHYTRSKVDLGLLAEITAAAGGSDDAVADVAGANTARHVYELWRSHAVDDAPDVLCARVAANLSRFTEGAVTAEAVMVDFDGLDPVGASPGWTGPRRPAPAGEGA